MATAQINKINAPQPKSVDFCSFWIDASDPNTLSFTSGLVSQINDKSGNNYNLTQSTALYRPAVSSNFLIFRSNAYLNMPQASINNASTWDMFLLINPISSSNWIMVKQHNGVNTYNALSMTLYASGSPFVGTLQYLYWHSSNSATIVNSSNALSLNTVQILGLHYDGSTLLMNRNGSAMSSTSSATSGIRDATTTTNFLLGGWISDVAGNSFNQPNATNFQLGELVFYNRNMTSTNRQRIEGYLAWKWGIQSQLPSNHPYFSANPGIPVYPNPYQYLLPTSGKKATLTYFDPTSVQGCLLWIDANDSSTVTIQTGVVVSVLDKSKKNNHLTNGTGFSYNVTKFNSIYPSFYNVSSSTARVGRNTDFSRAQPMTIFAIGQFISGTSSYPYLFDGVSSRVAFYYTSSAGTATSFFGGSGFGVTPTSPFFYSFVANTSSSQIYLNGTLAGSGNIGTNSMGGVTLGNAFDLTNSFTGHICEYLIFDSVLSSTQRQQIEGYLAWKWGLQASLPSTHPFVRGPPTPYPVLTLPKPILSTKFNPGNISGLTLWLDASDFSTLTFTGDNVTRWKDKSSAGKDATQSTASRGPTYVIDSKYKSLYFQRASTQFLEGPSLLTSTSFGIFLVYRTVAPASTQYVFFDYKKGTGGTGQNYLQHVIVSSATGGAITYSETPITLKDPTAQAITTNRYMYCYIDSPSNTTSNFTFNGNPVTTTFTNGGIANIATDAYGYALGALKTTSVSLTNTFDGYMNEVIVYLTEPTVIQRQQVEGYLAWKWGLVANLPSSHPFKLFPPPP